MIQKTKRLRWILPPAIMGLLAVLCTAAAVAANTYKIKKGDTLWDVARSHKVSVDSLLAANKGVRAESMRPGTTLVIPSGSAHTTKQTAKTRRYTVRKGDTLWGVAHKLGVRVSDITRANGIGEKDTLRLGQVLTIPPGPGSHNATTGLNQSGVCISDRVSVRLGPGTQHGRAATIDKGKTLTITGKKNGWYSVVLAGGTKGWIKSDFVRASAKKRDATGVAIAKVAKGAATDTAPSADNESASWSDGLTRTALSYRGTRYHRGGASPAAFDCSGFTMYVFGKAGIKLPHSSRAQFGCGTSVAKSDLQAGDLVFFRTGRSRGISHVGIALGDGTFVHASSARSRVRVDSLGSGYYSQRYVGARRVR